VTAVENLWFNFQVNARTVQIIGTYSHRGLAIAEQFNKTLAKILYKIQYAVESLSSNPKLIRAWVRHLPKVLNCLNNYSTRLIRVPGSSRWGLAPAIATGVERVTSRPSTKYKCPVGNDEIKLDTVRYLPDAECRRWHEKPEKGHRSYNLKIVVSENKPI